MATTTTFGFLPLSLPTSVNVTTSGGQYSSDIVTLANGTSVMAYASDGGALFLRALTSAGAGTGVEAAVATGVDIQPDRFANLAVLNNGNIVVTWADNAANQNVHYRIYSPTLTPVTGVLDIPNEAGADIYPDVAALTGGGFVIVEQYNVSATDHDIWAYTYSAAGVLGVEIAVNTTVATLDHAPSVVGLTDGGFAVGHERLAGADTEMWRSVWNANGTERLADTRFDANGSHNTHAQLTRLGLGFAVTYIDNGWTLASDDITYWRFDANGASVPGTPFTRGSTFAGNDNQPHAAVSGDGYAILAFNTGADDVNGTLVDPSGNAYAVNSALDAHSGAQGYPAVSWIDRTRFAVIESVTAGSLGTDGDGVGVAAMTFEVRRTVIGDGANDTITLTSDVFMNIVLGGGGNDVITTGSANDQLVGDAGDDTLNGGTGGDVMAGDVGDDTYFVDNLDDVVAEAAGAGTDTVNTALATYTLAANVERLNGAGAGQTLNGNSLDNTINGTSGFDVLRGFDGSDTLNGGGSFDLLDGGTGADTMAGGAGDDSYVVDDSGDVVIENAGEGSDTVDTTLASYTLGANVERLGGSGVAQSLFGNDLDNLINGTAGADTLNGLDGSDTLTASGGADLLDGGTGADTMAGGNGDDTYVVDDFGDVVTENAGAGTDTVIAALASYTLGANVENLSTVSTTGQTLNGNGIDNVITSLGGSDTLNGLDGADTLNGGDGNDRLDGGTGADAMAGGVGNDVYVVDDFGDVVTENAGEGTDAVSTGLAVYTLSANVENLNGTNAAGQTLIGNALGNIVIAGAGANSIFGQGGDDYVVSGATASTIDGGAGNDQMYGGAGNDYMVGGDGNDVIVGFGGADSLYGGAGDDYLVAGDGAGSVVDGGAGANSLWGAGGADYIVGGEGADLMVGSAGSDYLFGNAGNDTLYGGQGTDFLYSNAGNDFIWTDDVGLPQAQDFIYVGGGTGVDTVADFTAGNAANHDVVVISPASGIGNFTQLQAAMVQVGVYTVITMSGGDQLFLYNVQPFQLTAADFLFF